MATYKADDLLDAMEGISYVVDGLGNIAAYGRTNWQTFADENGGEALLESRNLIGRPILDFIAGDEVRNSYARYMDAILTETTKAITFVYHCDGPEVSRELRMAMTPVPSPQGKPSGILFHSIVMTESVRPPLNIFDFQAIRTAMKEDLTRPILALCSYCQFVRHPAGDDRGEWLMAEDYYRKGGQSDEIGRASCRERVEISVGAVSVKKKKEKMSGGLRRSREKQVR